MVEMTTAFEMGAGADWAACFPLDFGSGAGRVVGGAAVTADINESKQYNYCTISLLLLIPLQRLQGRIQKIVLGGAHWT